MEGYLITNSPIFATLQLCNVAYWGIGSTTWCGNVIDGPAHLEQYFDWLTTGFTASKESEKESHKIAGETLSRAKSSQYRKQFGRCQLLGWGEMRWGVKPLHKNWLLKQLRSDAKYLVFHFVWRDAREAMKTPQSMSKQNGNFQSPPQKSFLWFCNFCLCSLANSIPLSNNVPEAAINGWLMMHEDNYLVIK